MKPRDVARRVLARVDRQDAFATEVLGEALAQTALAVGDRALVTELVYGTLRHRARVDRALASVSRSGGRQSRKVKTALRMAAYEILMMRTPAHAAVHEGVGGVRQAGGQRVAGFANAVLRRLANEGEPALPPESSIFEHVEVAHSLPGWIARELAAAVGEGELASAASAMNEAPRVGLRAVADRDLVMQEITLERPEAQLEAVPYLPEGLWLRGGAPDTLSGFAAGRFTVQDPGAQMVARLCGAAPGERILDACSGLGSKAAHLAALSGGRAAIVAADSGTDKLARAQQSFGRLGVTDAVQTCAMDLTRPAPPVTGTLFDRVLLDAPCTGLGVLRRHPEAKWRLGPEDVTRLAALQTQLLASMAAVVRPGGVLVYAVCSFTRAEGPDQIDRFIAGHADFSVEESARTFPHSHGADAFFMARLRRAG